MSNAQDHVHMAQALRLARRGLYTTSPNPRVGCVIAHADRVVGQGWHQRAGEPHAEVYALREAGELARGATAYVTLEPCCHQGRTPPCSAALIQAGVTRVVAAMRDPDPRVAGQGLAQLAAAGIEVECGLLEAEARDLNPGFIKRLTQGLPWVMLKLAMSLDGRSAMADGESQWITDPQARAQGQRLRARACVVLTGADTLLHDAARLTVRPLETGLDAQTQDLIASRLPRRWVVDGGLRVPLDAAFFEAGPVSVATCCTCVPPAYAEAGHRVLSVPGATHVDLGALLRQLASEGVNEVLVEAGPRLAGAFTAGGWVDEYHFFVAPKLLGSSAQPVLQWDIARLAEAHELNLEPPRALGRDWYLRARPRANPTGEH